jgi:putative mRNA 3-end processing factor
MADLLVVSDAGLYCPAGDFWIDPWRSVPRAVITHAHADHARSGCDRYLCAAPGKLVMRSRLGGTVPIDTLRYGESTTFNGVKVSLHPAGHVLGSAQVRVEHAGQVWVVSGDYKTAPDPTCAPFEPVRCDVFITESTFGLPIYRWPAPDTIAAEINAWWRANQAEGKTSVLLAYALGKAQRLAAMIDPSIGPIHGHGAVMKLVRAYRDSGVRLPPIDAVPARAKRVGQGRALVIAPPSVAGSGWLRVFGEVAVAQASGWMTVRGIRRRRGFGTGFVLSDHADFPGLVSAVEATGARRVLVTHGSSEAFARFLRGRGLEADVLATRFTGEQPDRDDAGDGGDDDDVGAEAGPDVPGPDMSVPDDGAAVDPAPRSELP